MVAKKIPNACHWVTMIALCWETSNLQAREPAISNLDLRGLRVGGTTTLVLDGDDFGTAPRLLLPFAAKQELLPGSTDKRATIRVTLADEVPPGFHHLRVVNDNGVSLPVVIGVDRLPQQLLAVSIDQLPAALHGVVSGGSVVETKFQGKAKQKVLVEVEAQRLGSKLRPILHLFGPRSLQLGWSWGTPSLHGDTRLEATLPEEGLYTISLHDVEYAAPAPSYFRLRVGNWSFVDQVFPPVLAKGKAQGVELIGMAKPVRMELGPTTGTGFLPLAWPREGVWSGPRPFVMVSPHAEFVEGPVGDKVHELPPGPVGVSGRLLAPYEEDRYRVPVTPGKKKVRCEVFAERYGSPLDVALVLRNEKGDVLSRAEDGPGTLDPVLEYAVPDKVTALIIGVVDAQGRGGRQGVYRLTIDPQLPAASKEDYKLSTTVPRITLPAGGRGVIPVLIERKGYQGKVDLAAAGLPAGVRLEGTTIPEGADGALVTVQRSEASFEAAITTWRGKTADGVEEYIVVKGHPLERLQPWLATEIAVAPAAAKATDFAVDWRDLRPNAPLVPGSKLVLPLKVIRLDLKTVVRFTLLTSQAPQPLVNNQPDPNRALRQEKAAELSANAVNGDFTVLVPVELAAPSYDVTIQAELLSLDKKNVLAVAYTPVRKMPVNLPLVVRLNGTGRIEALVDLKKGATVKIQGKVERREGFKGEVGVNLMGLPAGAKADPVTLKADVSDFTLNVVLPANTPAGEIRGLKLSGSAAPDSKQPNVRVRSREMEVTLILLAGK